MRGLRAQGGGGGGPSKWHLGPDPHLGMRNLPDALPQEGGLTTYNVSPFTRIGVNTGETKGLLCRGSFGKEVRVPIGALEKRGLGSGSGGWCWVVFL